MKYHFKTKDKGTGLRFVKMQEILWKIKRILEKHVKKISYHQKKQEGWFYEICLLFLKVVILF